MINIRELVENPSLLNVETLAELKAMVEKYPFFQVARLLYLSNLYRLHSHDFGAELRKASIFVPDRTALFALTEGTNYELTQPKSISGIETEGDGDRTMTLISSFLGQGNIETSEEQGQARTVPSAIDLTFDYASFLEQQDSDNGDNGAEKEKAPQLKGGELIDSFIAETHGKQRFDIQGIDESEFTSPALSDADEEIYTESMVNIYIKQGRYKEALEILRKICLNNPKKSHNFAAQMELLRVILNEDKPQNINANQQN